MRCFFLLIFLIVLGVGAYSVTCIDGEGGRRVLTAVEYLGSVGVGVTVPRVFRANDGNVYVVKLQNNPMGTKVLVNEYIACWFGERMELCFPPSDLIQIDELQRHKSLRAPGIRSKIHFASQYIPSNKYVVRNNLSKANNKSAMAGVMLFDHMFHNIDRTKNRKNLLVRLQDSAYVLYAIDHSHLFVRGRWNSKTLEKLATKIVVNRRRAYGWLLTYFFTSGDFTPYVARVKAITEDELAQLVESIPQEWLPKTEERAALLSYMIKRCHMVDQITLRLCQSIPDVNRRTHLY